MPMITAGNQGEKVKDDCFAALDASHGNGLDIAVETGLGPAREGAVRAFAQGVFDFYGIASVKVHIKDTGAADFVLAARIEACIKQAGLAEKDFLPEMREENRTGTDKQRMRVSRLYVPGNSPRMMIKAGAGKPHAVILDLEDSVAFPKKFEARLLVRNALRQVDFFGAERMVRINQLPLGLEDLDQIVPNFVNVILIPKCESAETVRQVNDRIAEINQADSLDREIFLMPIIESSKGVINAADIAGAADNIAALTIGLEDYTADLGVVRTLEGTESFYARSHLVNVCKAFGIQAIDSVFSDVGDSQGLTDTVLRSKALGFEGMGCIHPRQIDLIHKGYAPEAKEIEKAKKIVTAFEEALENGLGVVSLGTKMIDPPVVERAKQVIEKAIAFNLMEEE
jgi:citrate lyase subunit beta/citryl-CoA lyase